MLQKSKDIITDTEVVPVISDIARPERSQFPAREVATPIDEQKIIEYLDAFGLSTNLTDNEKKQFVEIAVAYQLNPFKREIYCIKYMKNVKQPNGQWEKEAALSIITGYEVYLKRAERTGKSDGWNLWTEGSGENIVAKIELFRKDWSRPLKHEVAFREYNQGNKIWKDKPLTMIKKVVIAQAFRMAYPDEMGGMPYTSDELPDEMTQQEQIETAPKSQIELAPEADETDMVTPDVVYVPEVTVKPKPQPAKAVEPPPPGGVKVITDCLLCGTRLIKGRDEYGGGYVCWKKKDGCDSKYDDQYMLTKVSKDGAVRFFDKFKTKIINCPPDEQLYNTCDGLNWDIARVHLHFGLTVEQPPVDLLTSSEEVPDGEGPEVFPPGDNDLFS